MPDQSQSIFATVTVPYDITQERVGDLLGGALEGGSNYWINIVSRFNCLNKSQGGPTYLHEVPFVSGGAIKIFCDNPEPGPVRITRYLDADALRRGLNTMAQKFPKQFQDFLESKDDAETSDIFLQCCIFGNVRFS